jgi:hypothetical protein
MTGGAIDEPARPSLQRFLAIAGPPFVLSLVLTFGCYLAAGPSFGLYLGGLTLAMVLAPPLVMAYRPRIEQLIAAASLVDGVGVVWLVAMFRSDLTFAQWLSAYVLLAACTLAVTGLAALLLRLLGRPEPATALIVLFAMLWLTWPIWLSAWIDHPVVVRAIGWLAPVHPLLAMNGLLLHLGVWGEWPMMYKLTSLGQDVPYSLPSSVAISAAFHFLFGGALLLAIGRGNDRAAVDQPDRAGR